jgi:hypothetical protein
MTWMISPALVPEPAPQTWPGAGWGRSGRRGGVDGEDLVLLEGREKRALGQFDALEQAGGGGARLVGRAVERAGEAVVDGQQVAGEAGGAVDLGVAAIALGALADVLGVGERAEQAVLQLGGLGAEGCDLVGLDRLVGDLHVLVERGLNVVEERLVEVFGLAVFRHVFSPL